MAQHSAQEGKERSERVSDVSDVIGKLSMRLSHSIFLFLFFGRLQHALKFPNSNVLLLLAYFTFRALLRFE